MITMYDWQYQCWCWKDCVHFDTPIWYNLFRKDNHIWCCWLAMSMMLIVYILTSVLTNMLITLWCFAMIMTISMEIRVLKDISLSPYCEQRPFGFASTTNYCWLYLWCLIVFRAIVQNLLSVVCIFVFLRRCVLLSRSFVHLVPYLSAWPK